jgi:uncharacterized protein YyaL (SSP411 family)
LQERLDKDFWDVDDGGYFSDDGSDKNLPLRAKDFYDGVHPSANSLAAYNLIRLYQLTGKQEYRHKFDRLLALTFDQLKRYPSGYSFLALAMDFAYADAKVAVIGDESWAEEFYREQVREFNPYVLWAKAGGAWPVAEGKSGAVHVCTEGHCLAPAKNRDEALKTIAL